MPAWSWPGAVALVLALGASVAIVASILEGGPFGRQVGAAGGGAVIGMLASYLARHPSPPPVDDPGPRRVRRVQR